MVETQQETTHGTIKNQVTGKRIVQGFIDNKNLTQIAQELGLTRGGLYARLDKTEVQEVMILEVRELETKLQEWIQELHDSPNSANKRHAISELGKIVKHVQDKSYPSIFRHETINVNIDLNKLQEQQHTLTETLNRLPPSTRDTFWATYSQVQAELQNNPT